MRPILSLRTFINLYRKPVEQKGKAIRIGGTEFKNAHIIELCGSKGIKRDYSNARTPQQNGVAERKNRTLIEAARTMLADSKLPTMFWTEAVRTACYVLNRVLVTSPHNKTPYALLTGNIPSVSHFKPFGCHVTILNTSDHLGKFDGKADEATCYKHDKANQSVGTQEASTNPAEIFQQELARLKGQEQRATSDAKDVEELQKRASTKTVPTGSIPGCSSSNWKSTDTFINDKQQQDFPSPSDLGNNEPSLGIFSTSSYDDEFGADLKFRHNCGIIFMTSRETIIQTFNIVCLLVFFLKLNQELYYWTYKAMNISKQLLKNSQEENAIVLAWGIVVRNKARLVAQGHRQEVGLDYVMVERRLEALLKNRAINWILAVASYMGFMVYQMDVNRALIFMKRLDEEVSKVVKLLRTSSSTKGLQDKYVQESRENEFDLEWCTGPATTPYEAPKPKSKNEPDSPVNVHFAAQGIKHSYYFKFGTVKKISSILKANLGGLMVLLEVTFVLEVYSDIDYAGQTRIGSTTGGCQFLGRRLISWQCKKQTIVATSSTEAEYVAAANCCGQTNGFQEVQRFSSWCYQVPTGISIFLLVDHFPTSFTTGVWTEPTPVKHYCKLYNYKTGYSEWPTCSWKSDGYCNGGNLPRAYIVGNSLHYQDYEWYEALMDCELNEQALRNKAIMEGLISDDESSNDGWKRWESHEITYHDHDELKYENETHDERQELCEAHELLVCNIRRFKMIKYSFGQDEEYVAVKEDEYDDLEKTSNDAYRAYQEIFRMMDEEWMDLVKEISTSIGEEFTNMEISKCWSLETSRYVVPTGRVVVPTGRYVVPAGKVIIIVSPGRLSLVPTVEFRISKAEGLHKGYDKMQKILSQLNQLKAKPEDEDINLKFLRALPSSWSQVALTLKTKGGLELLSFDDLYYKLKTLEVDIKGYSTFSSSQSAGPSHSAFVSTTSASKKMSYADSPSYSSSTYTAPSNSKTGSHRSGNVIEDVLQSFVADTKEASTAGDAGEFALMGVTSEVHNCPFGCDNKYNELQKQHNELTRQYHVFKLSSKLFANMKLNFEGQPMQLLAAMLPQDQEGEGAGVAAQAVPPPIPEPIPEPMPEPDQPQDHLSTPPRQQTSDPIAPVFEHGQSSDPNIASFSRVHETDDDPFTSTNVEDEPLGGSFHASPPRSTQAPPAGHTSGGAEDLITLTVVSSVVSTLVQKVNSLETELKDTKKLFKDVVGKLVKKVKAMEVKLKTKKRKVVVSDSDQEEGGEQDVDLDALLALANAAVIVDSNIPPGGASSSHIPTDVPTGVAPAGVSNKGKTPMVEEDITVKERTLKQMEDDRLGEEAAKRLHDEEQAQVDRQRAELNRRRQQEVLASAMYYTEADWINIMAQVEANASLSKTLLGDDVTEDNFPVRMAALIKRKKQALAEKLAKERMERPMTPVQQRTYMRQFVKNQSSALYSTGWTKAKVESFTDAQLKEEFEKIQKALANTQVQAFSRTLKRTGPELEEPSSKQQKSTEAPIPSVPDVPQPPVVSSPKSSGTRRKSLGRNRLTKPKSILKELDLDADDKTFIKVVSDEDSTDEAPILWSALAGWEVISTPLGEINALYRSDQSTKHFTTLREILHMVDRQDLLKLYGMVVTYYENHLVAGAGLMLWGDLQVLIDSQEGGKGSFVWNHQSLWQIRSWRLYTLSNVHVLETVSGEVLYMFADVSYPLSVKLMERMLKHKLEIDKDVVGNDMTTAEQLIRFIKNQIAAAQVSPV
ncbi:anticodon-binding aminoacyl-tRNA synthetase, class 1a [Tanacetum coccineum]